MAREIQDVVEWGKMSSTSFVEAEELGFSSDRAMVLCGWADGNLLELGGDGDSYDR